MSDDHDGAETLERDRADLEAENDAAIERTIRSRTRRSFVVGAVAAAAGYGGWRWLRGAELDGGLAAPLRRTFELNERLGLAYQTPTRMATEFPASRAVDLRVNGGEGLSQGFDPAAWRLQVVGVEEPRRFAEYRDDVAYDTVAPPPDTFDAGDAHEQADTKSVQGQPDASAASPPSSVQGGPGLLLTLDAVRAFPRHEMTIEFKCIEGWSQIVTWAGTRFADFARAFPPARGGGPGGLARYAALATPDNGYYVGLDLETMLHPQTLLCYEMNGAPLTLEHGAPLRLYTPFKYGIKQLKRVGRITFTDERPPDFWAERGYDWYSGH